MLNKSSLYTLLIALLLPLLFTGCSNGKLITVKASNEKSDLNPKPESKLAQRIYSNIKDADKLEILGRDERQANIGEILLAVIPQQNKRYTDLSKGILMSEDYPGGPARGMPTLIIKWFKADKVAVTLTYYGNCNKSASTKDFSTFEQAIKLNKQTWQLLEQLAEPNWHNP